MAEPVKPTSSQGRRLPAWLQVLLVLGALLLLDAPLATLLPALIAGLIGTGVGLYRLLNR